MPADISVFGVFGTFGIFAKVSVFGMLWGPWTLVVGTKVVQYGEKLVKNYKHHKKKSEKMQVCLEYLHANIYLYLVYLLFAKFLVSVCICHCVAMYLLVSGIAKI